MKLEDINEGDKVVYIPHYLLMGDKTQMVKPENLGIVSSKNEELVFVNYNGSNTQATRPEDLYSLRNRPDLVEILDAKFVKV